MNSFHYRFEKILKNKERIEQELAAQCAAVKDLIEKETTQLNESAEKGKQTSMCLAAKRNSQAQTMHDIQEIRMGDAYLTYLAERMETIRGNIRSLNIKLAGLQRMLIEAKREKKTFEKLKEHDAEKYSELLAAEEQKAIDESATFRYRAHGLSVS